MDPAARQRDIRSRRHAARAARRLATHPGLGPAYRAARGWSWPPRRLTRQVVSPGGFDQFVAAAGEPARDLRLPEPVPPDPARDLRLPEPVPPDPARLTQLAAAHGIQILAGQVGTGRGERERAST